MTEPSQDLPPIPLTLADRFELEAVVGRGAAGTVFKAQDRQRRAAVAVKIYHGVAGRTEIEQFEREARRVEGIITMSLVPYRAWGVTPGGEMWLAMDWQGGQTLRQRLRVAPLTLRQAVTLGRDLAFTLHKLHERDLAHRNIKPDNIFLPPELFTPRTPYGPSPFARAAVLSDIAVARNPRRVAPVVSPELLDAAQGFMAPEQASAGESGPAADVYSLGAVLFLCLAGCMPFPEDDGPVKGPWRADRREAPRLVDLRPGVPEAVSDVVADMLAFDPAARIAADKAWFRLPDERAELGWDEDSAPPRIERGPTGERRAVAEAPRPVHVLSDALLHREILHLLWERDGDSDVRSALAAIAQNHCFQDRNIAVVCALCGRRREHHAFTDLVGSRELRHWTHEESYRAASPTLCTDCLRAPWTRVHAAVEETLALLSSGDPEAPLGRVGPSRGLLRGALRELYLAYTPHIDTAPCGRCGRTDRALVGVWMNLCLRCHEGAVASRDAWFARRTQDEDERVRQAYAKLVVRAEARAKSRGIRRTSPGSDVALPPRPRFEDEVILIHLRTGAHLPNEDRAYVDDCATKLALLLEHHAVMGIRRPDKEVCPGGGYHATSILPVIVGSFVRHQTISPGPKERLLLAAATVLEAIADGARYFGKDDDNLYVDETGYFSALASLF